MTATENPAPLATATAALAKAQDRADRAAARVWNGQPATRGVLAYATRTARELEEAQATYDEAAYAARKGDASTTENTPATFTASHSEHTGQYAILDATGRIVQDGITTRTAAEQCAAIRSMTPAQFERCSDAYRRGC